MTRITILADNDAARQDCGVEHGLSCFIELENGEKWLWDTGQSELFLHNAQRLGIDVLQAQGLALSHGHYDHTGGLPALLQKGFGGPIYAHPDALKQRHVIRDGKLLRSIGLPRVMPPEALPGVNLVSNTTELAPGLRMFCDIGRLPGMRENVRGFFWDTDGTQADSVPDDAFLLLEVQGKNILILGCCHAGLGNTMYALRTDTGVERVDTVLGGLHLGDAGPVETEAQVQQAAEVLREFGVRNIYAGHCTGTDARALLASHMRDDAQVMIRALGAGTCLEF